MLNVLMLSVIILNVLILNVIILSVIMPSVMAPNTPCLLKAKKVGFFYLFFQYFFTLPVAAGFEHFNLGLQSNCPTHCATSAGRGLKPVTLTISVSQIVIYD
jgi:hypothetical protein